MVLTTPRTEFVSVVAWIFIVLAAIAFTSGAGAGVWMFVATYATPMNEDASADYTVASFLSWDWEVTPRVALVGYSVWITVSLLVLVTSVALAKRKRWAHGVFTLWMGAGAVLTALTTAHSIWFLFAVNWLVSPVGKLLIYTSQLLGIMMEMFVVVTFLWIIRRLRMPDVLAEFQ